MRPALTIQPTAAALLLATLLTPLLAGTAAAAITSASSTTTGSTCTGANDTDGFCGSSTSLPTNDGATLQSRFAWNINADAGAGANRATSSNAQHNVSFSATAPGGYRLDITTSRVGEMGRTVDLTPCNGSVDTSLVLGISNVALSSGSLSLPDPGSIATGSTTVSTPINQSSAAILYRSSNGVPQNHTLTFTWNGSTNSDSCEVAVRQGQQNGSTTGCSQCEYPGSPARTQSTDGHIVTVTFTSLCGNGVIDSAVSEQCDQGAANGTASSCCNSNCQFRGSGQTCRASAGVCDLAETCTGSSSTCPADAKSTAVCRPAADVCDQPESCDNVNNTCPTDEFLSGPTCRNSAGLCDVAETCTGNAAACPDDELVGGGTPCRTSAGVCDLAETCTGFSAACPADIFAGSETECRAAAGTCDIAESCTGDGAACPDDVLVNVGTPCRAAAGDCDITESCTGDSAACPDDAFVDSGTPCRTADDVCDITESCTGDSAACPDDQLVDNGTSCADDVFCNGGEECQAGVCQSGLPPCDDLCDEEAEMCTAALPCADEPLDGCHTAAKSALVVKQGAKPAKRLLKWKWSKGAELDKSAFGDPLSTTGYAVCLYATDGGTPARVQMLSVDGGSLWSDNGDKGFAYDDPAASVGGLRSIGLRPGVAGKSMLKVLAKGPAVPAMTSASADALLSVDPLVVVQLVNSQGACWESAFSSEQTRKLTGEMFKGIAP